MYGGVFLLYDVLRINRIREIVFDVWRRGRGEIGFNSKVSNKIAHSSI
jgi:hypothetical protein